MNDRGGAGTDIAGREDVAEQLGKILASKAFRQADRLKRFLRFIVGETIAGRAEALKEFTVGVEVFGKDRTFDPRSDPIVRVQARRLRAQLERYYAEEAAPGEIIIEVPKGAYAAVFRGTTEPRHAATNPPELPRPIFRNSVLVFPFADHSLSANQELFCAGLTDEVTFALANVESIRTISLPRFQAGAGLWETARQLQAAMVLSGSVRCSDRELRVTTNLIDAVSGQVLWSVLTDCKPDDPISAQREVAASVRKKLSEEIVTGPVTGSNPPTQNLTAYNYYVQGRYHLNQRTDQSLHKAVEFFEKAIAEDSEYANAYSGVADAYTLLGHYGALSPAEVLTKAASSAARAVLMDEHSVEARTSLAHVKSTQDWDWAGAEQEFQRAIRLDARYATAHHWYAVSLLAPLGRLEEARAEMLSAQALDPTSSIIARDLARIYYYMNDLDTALEQCDRTIELNPHFLPAYWMLGFVQEQRGEFEEASAAFQRAMQFSPDSPSIRAALGHTYALSGKVSKARRIITELLDLGTRRYVSPFELALLHFAIDDLDGGFQWLTRAFQDRSFELVLLKVDPRLDAIKPHPRFRELFAQLRLP